jgi:hypothetical protein
LAESRTSTFRGEQAQFAEADVVLVISDYDVDRFIAVFGKASDDATARGWWDALDRT